MDKLFSLDIISLGLHCSSLCCKEGEFSEEILFAQRFILGK